MSTVPDRWDHAISWVPDPAVQGSVNQKPVFLSEYVEALEALVRSGDSGPDDLQRLRRRMRLGADSPPRPRTVATSNKTEGQEGFRTHSWVGFESAEQAHCVACGVSSASIQSMKRCTEGVY
jgi:hypothetical protein